jgi:hypothetical protein
MKKILFITTWLIVPAVVAGQVELSPQAVTGGGGTLTYGVFFVTTSGVSTIGQPAAGIQTGGTMELSSGFIPPATVEQVVDMCSGAASCCDADGDLVRDDACVYCVCDDGNCDNMSLESYADMGGAFGACPPEGFTNIHDRNHALLCFGGQSTCESMFEDAGGAFGECRPDGFCNVHDANHAAAVFAGESSCGCDGGPAPEFDIIVDDAVLQVVPEVDKIQAGDAVAVQVLLQGELADLQSFQLHFEVSGGKSGRLEIIDIVIEDFRSFVFAYEDSLFEAVNVNTGQLLAGVDYQSGVATRGGAYLATVIVQASPKAAGEFTIDLRHDSSPQDQTYLVASHAGHIMVNGTTPGVITVTPRPIKGSGSR